MDDDDFVPGFVIIHDAMERRMQSDLDALRDSLPEDERPIFEAERHIHRQEIINHYGRFGSYPEIAGITKSPQEA